MSFPHYPSQEKGSKLSQGYEAAQNRFLAVVRDNADVFLLLTSRGELCEICPIWQAFTGQTRRKSFGYGWLNAFHPADRLSLEEALFQTITTNAPAERICYLHRRNGSYCLMRVRIIPVRDPSEVVREVILCGTDITKQELAGYEDEVAAHPAMLKQAEAHLYQIRQALHQSREELYFLTETVPQLIWVTRPDGFTEYFNRRWYEYTGASVGEHIGDRWLDAVHPDDRQRTWAVWHTAVQTGQPYDVEYRLREGKTGEYRWFLARGLPFTDEQGHVLKWFGTCTNIDEHKHIEEVLLESESRFRKLLESNLIGFVVSDQEGAIYEANDAFLELLGYSREDVEAGRLRWTEITPPEYMEPSLQATQKIREYGAFPFFEKEYIAKDGRRVPILIGGIRLRQEGSKHIILTMTLDLTARKEVERQKDLFLGMTSHELKTPLAALKGTFQLLQRRVKRLDTWIAFLPLEVRIFLEDLSARVAASIHQVDVQTRLINDLLDVSCITANTLKLELGHYDLVSIVRETVEDLRVTAPGRALVLELPIYAAARVLVDKNRISQVVANYVNNALRYSPPDQPVWIGLTVKAGFAQVWVQDNGPGLSEADQAELWQRFHQVKSVAIQSGPGKGLGLGLYICQVLISQHRGEVGVESVLGKGSTFWFRLPIVNSIT